MQHVVTRCTRFVSIDNDRVSLEISIEYLSLFNAVFLLVSNYFV